MLLGSSPPRSDLDRPILAIPVEMLRTLFGRLRARSAASPCSDSIDAADQRLGLHCEVRRQIIFARHRARRSTVLDGLADQGHSGAGVPVSFEGNAVAVSQSVAQQ